jgi:hypothetical protein
MALSEQCVSEAPDAFDLRYNLNEIVPMTDVFTSFLRADIQVELYRSLLPQSPEFLNRPTVVSPK